LEKLQERDCAEREVDGWMDGIKMDLQEIEWEGVDWIHLA
jgi:hypothetical protein